MDDGKSLGKVENWVELHNEAVSKYDTNLEEIETRLSYIINLGKRALWNKKKEEGT